MKKTILTPIALLTIALVTWYACEKEPPDPPEGQTNKLIFEEISVTPSYREAEIGYNIENLDQNDVESLGICYNTSGEPTQKDNMVSLTIDSSGTGTIDGLSPETEYYVRLYAEISGTTIYSDGEISFLAGLNGTFKDSRDGQTYEWVRIGGQIWMAENLNYKLADDDVGNDWCYENNSSNCDMYGRLYDWAAVMQGTSSSSSNPSVVQGVCPDGWHIPSDEEWKELEMHLGMSQSAADNTGYRGTNEGSKLAGNASLWNSGDLSSHSEFGASGFTALPGGHP